MQPESTSPAIDTSPGSHDLPIVTAPAGDGPALVAFLLREQQQLTAVEQFSQAHEQLAVPAQAKYYSRLIPASPPGPGQQYAFDVDLDRCSGCKACVTACHSLNGLDTEETWRDVGLMVGGSPTNPVMQHVTTACHHCLDPACLAACPVDAYEKDALTGIVRHLDDQCFGCQYCTLACPYDVPKYHSGKGIVRKCDMCSDRLTAGEAPACVQACPHEAISIRTVDVEQVREDAEANHFLPAAPEPHLTLPTTTYRTRRVLPRNMLPADYQSVSPQHPHWPLIVMLVLTQLSVGAFAIGLVLESLASAAQIAAFRPVHATSALGFGLLAIAASVFHLGRPQYAFRAVIGLRHSWLSREIVAFGGFAGCAVLYALATWLAGNGSQWITPLGWGVAGMGAAGLFCSIMIYAFTRREFWSFSQTGGRFLMTAAILGIAATWLITLLLGVLNTSPTARSLVTETGSLLGRSLIIAMAGKLLFELALLTHLTANRNSPLKRSARLLIGPLSSMLFARIASGVLGGIAMPLLLLSRIAAGSAPGESLIIGVAGGLMFGACLAGELLERYLFFAAVAAPRMPGGLRP